MRKVSFCTDIRTRLFAKLEALVGVLTCLVIEIKNLMYALLYFFTHFIGFIKFVTGTSYIKKVKVKITLQQVVKA